ncbi:uncharacterized protein LOC122531048 isoform X2 [Frieseomelitta varia]|uniref:uncharacterized protein LOC122531048 isoform X2 n=1 Tax=Frieseomelitta varia TaxID=561572 RepID=UPI001CB68062|nr:uncharacterized protein LOC122531048 isoform X2 [Frieseomelitta varia]
MSLLRDALFPWRRNMILGRVAVYFLRLISLANVGFASQLRPSVSSWSSFSVCALIVLPSDTQQWSLLGLNLWPSEQTVERPSVDGFDLSGNSISRVTTTCEQKVQNNLTYVISPGFPNLIDWPMNCSVVVQKIDRQVSQLRIDFVHFNIGQPNSRTGVCDEDIMEIRNGRSVFQMCGWNSGQHLYIDMDDDEQSLTLDLRLLGSLQPRMWEMRIVQLGFDQRAPTGCLQYFQGSNGTLKSLNFLSNGRFLANQDYLLCVRQERGMCGISYAPCSPDSFRIGLRRTQLANSTTPNANSNSNSNSNSTVRNTDDAGSLNGTNVEIEGSGSNPMDEGGTSMNTSSPTEQEVVGPSNGAVYGQERCRDRVLIPCDFEEFITPGNNEAGICNLEHCGSSLCDRNELDEEGNCRVETWATPFRVRIAFGPGQDTGTTLEDNIGMCLVYEQLPCIA